MISIHTWKAAAVVVALIPIGFFLMFAIGEGVEGWPHYFQALIPICVVLLAWWKPQMGGYILITLGLLFAVVYAVSASTLPVPTIALVEFIVAVPVIVSGYLFLRAQR